MCGIGAILNYQLDGEKVYQITRLLLLGLESRGHDASGIFIVFEDGSFFLRKMYVTASKFVAEYLDKIAHEIPWNKVLYITLHCRSATKGSPLDNENNHPLYEILENNLVTVVHNGKISGIVGDLSNYKKREVDSDYLLSGVRKYKKYEFDVIKETIDKAQGIITCIYADLKGTIMWYRDSARNVPLYIFNNNDVVILASTEEIIKSTLEKVGVEMKKSSIQGVEENHLILFDYWKGKVIQKARVIPYRTNVQVINYNNVYHYIRSTNTSVV